MGRAAARLLLDTPAVLLAGTDRLGPVARAAVLSADDVAVSVASLWEIAIKVSLGKLARPAGLADALKAIQVTRMGIEEAHVAAVEALPLHHRDPFDRMLIVQAISAGYAVLTSDRAFGAYPVDVVDPRL